MARKEKTIHYIYKTTCNVTGRWYVGMHSTSNENDGYMGSGKRLRYSIRKHGKDNHTKEILSYHDSRELLVEAEKLVITDDMVLDKNCMNLKLGGSGGFINEEHRLKAYKGSRESFKKHYQEDEVFRAKLIAVAIDKITKYNNLGIHVYNTFEGKSHSEETKQLMSEKAKERIGNKNSQFGTCWITKDGLNKKINKEDLDSFINDGWVKGRKIQQVFQLTKH